MSALVSVFCLAYNHEDYIARSLDSMVCQQTDFEYEIFVHDDASTDRTAEILREYEARYPDKIHGYYETENQYYNPALHITRDLLVPLSSGEFFAFCECDDSWEDPLKLQRQVDFLRSHPDYAMCVHTAYKHIVGTDESEDKIYPAGVDEDCDFPPEELIRRGAGMFATNSFMVRRPFYVDMPECFKMQDFNDYSILMNAAMNGKVYCLSQPMSRHNEGVKDSWTVRIWNDPENRVKHQKAMLEYLSRIEAHFGRYHEAFAGAIAEREADILNTEFTIAVQKNDKETLKQPRFRTRWRSYRFHRILNDKFPWLVRLKHKIFG